MLEPLMPSSFDRKVVWVTGSSRGIGRVIASHLASLGARVAVHGTSPTSTRAFDEADSLEAVAREIADMRHTEVTPVHGNLSEPDTVQRIVAEIHDQLGPIDVLIACAGGDIGAAGTGAPNAGKPDPNDAVFVSLEDMHAVFDRNLISCILCCRAVAPEMMERRQGRIITVASVDGLHGTANGSMYATAKAAVVEYSRCLAVQLRPYNVPVNVIAPGGVLTPRFRASRTLDARRLVPDGTWSATAIQWRLPAQSRFWRARAEASSAARSCASTEVVSPGQPEHGFALSRHASSHPWICLTWSSNDLSTIFQRLAAALHTLAVRAAMGMVVSRKPSEGDVPKMPVQTLSPAWGITILRATAGLILVVAAFEKFFGGGFAGFTQVVTSLGIPLPQFFGIFIPLLELIGGALLLVGLGARWVAVLFVVEFVVTSFVLKVPRQPPFGGWDSMRIDLMLLATSVAIVAVGPGAFALESLMLRRRSSSASLRAEQQGI